MPPQRPATIAAYIRAAPPPARPHLKRLHQILRRVAPDAEETIKWGVPFFVEPRFLFSFAAFKTYCVLVPGAATLKALRGDLKAYQTTANFFKIPYDKPVPVALVRKLATHSLRRVRARTTGGFW